LHARIDTLGSVHHVEDRLTVAEEDHREP
jgi:hypothetical protein